MDPKTKIEKLQAIKEEYARKKALLAEAKLLREAARVNQLSTLLEGDLEQAELILAAKDVLAKLQEMAEDLAKISAQEVFPLVDNMRAAFGLQIAERFEQVAQDALNNALGSVRKAKEQISTALLQVEGKLPANDMAFDDGSQDSGDSLAFPDSDMADEELPFNADGDEDDFGGAEAASGPEDEPLGRGLKESYNMEVAGAALLETQSLASLMGWLLAEAASAMPRDEFEEFATKAQEKSQRNPQRMAGWIGSKKMGGAAMAQLSAPSITSASGVVEGKSYSNNPDDDDEFVVDKKAAAKNDKEFRRARQGKNDPEAANKDDDVNEGRSHRYDPEDEDGRVIDKKASAKNDRNFRDHRKNKRDPEAANRDDDSMSEAHKLAEAMAQIIEANILETGKGSAAQVVNQYVGGSLTEDEGYALIEAFVDLYGMKPGAYSVMKAKELAEAGMPALKLNPAQSLAAVGVLSKAGDAMAQGGKSAGSRATTSLNNQLSPQERAVVSVINRASKQAGQDTGKIADLTHNTTELLGQNKDKKTGGSPTKTGGAPAPVGAVAENINAAQWPVAPTGQYKGEPMQTDYMKLKPASSKAAAPKSDAPKSDAPKSDAPKDEGESKSTPAPKAEFAPKAKAPVAKDEAPKSEEPKKAPPFKKATEKKEELAEGIDQSDLPPELMSKFQDAAAKLTAAIHSRKKG